MKKIVVLPVASGVLRSKMDEALAKEGHNVAVLELRTEAAYALARMIEANGGSAIGVDANIVDKDSVVDAKNKGNKAFGKCDILINDTRCNYPMGKASDHFFSLDALERSTYPIYNGIGRLSNSSALHGLEVAIRKPLLEISNN